MGKRSFASVVVVLASVMIATMFLVQGVGSVIAADASSSNVLRVIVFAREDPQSLTNLMKDMKDLGASEAKKLQIINAVSGVVSTSAYQRLKVLSDVSAITVDHQRKLNAMPEYRQVTPDAPQGQSTTIDPMIEPEAIYLTHAIDGQDMGYSGQGVKVGFIDLGVDIRHPDLAPAIAAYVDTTGGSTKDDYGHGTATASMVGAQGDYVFNEYTKEYMRIKGMAPDAKIYAAKVFDMYVGWESNIIAGIEWCVQNDVDVLSCSVGETALVANGVDPVSLAMTAAANAGVAVFIAAANEGPGQGTECQPSVAKGVISVGATKSNRLLWQARQYGTPIMDNGLYVNSQVASWSSRPPTADGRMAPDIMAPGADGWSLAPRPWNLWWFSGTSMAAPVAAGCTALLMSAFINLHPNTPLPGPAYWEQLIRSTADNLGYPAFDQTSGLINVSAALNVLMNSKPGFVLDNNEWSVTSADTTGLTVKVTAAGSKPQKLTIEPTVFAPMNGMTMAWDDIVHTRTIGWDEPIFAVSVEHMITIPAGTDFLEVRTTWPDGSPFFYMGNALYDSEGAYVNSAASFSGYGKLALCQVAMNGPDPPLVDGTPWKLVVYNPWYSSPVGDVLVKTQVVFFQEVPGGWVSSSASRLSLSAGGSGSFKLTLNGINGLGPGNYFGQVRVSNGEQTATIPVVLTVPMTLVRGVGTFSGVLKGSDMSYTGGEFYYYQFDVPSGTKNIMATTSWEHEGNVIWTFLVSPSGRMMVQNGAGNDLLDWVLTWGAGEYNTTPRSEQVVWSDPEPGRWMVGVFGAGFWGGGFEEKFTGKVILNAKLLQQSALSLKGSAGAQLTQTLTVSNPGVEAMEVFGIASSNSALAWSNVSYSANLGVSIHSAEDKYLVMVSPGTKMLDLRMEWAAGDSPLAINVYDPLTSEAGTSASPAYGTQINGFASVAIGDPMPGIWTIYVDFYGNDSFTPVQYTLSVDLLSMAGCGWLSIPATTIAPLLVEPGNSMDIGVTVNVPINAKGTLTATLYLMTVSGDRLGSVPVTLKVV